MRELRLALLSFILISAASGISYYLAMRSGGSISISSDNQDWAGFGSYIGGILAPAASLLAGYMVYKGFASNAYQQKLQLARESISRIELELDKKLDAPFKNMIFGDNYYDLPFKKIIYALSKNEIETTEVTNKAILSLLHNIAMTTDSVRYYIDLLNKLPSTEKDNHWLGTLEQSYWIDKYSPVCSRMVRVVGQSAFENKINKDQLKSFNFVIRGDSYT